MAPNFERSTPTQSFDPTQTTTTTTTTKIFNPHEVVRSHLSSSPSSALQDLEQLSQKAMAELSSFIASTTTLQLSSFGPTGLVVLDLLNRSGLLPTLPVVFIDTLHHFDETHQLVQRVRARYPAMRLHVYKPKGCETRQDFEARFGERLWERVPSKFAYYTKVEPRDRALAELGVSSYINGRRKSQGNKRGELCFLDVDAETGVTRVQPLFDWSFEQVWTYLTHHQVPYNSLHDQGFKSVGDFMTSSAVSDDDDERSGRWKGTGQTECGLHLSPSQLALLGASSIPPAPPSNVSARTSSLVAVAN